MELSTLLAVLAVALGIGVQAWVGIGFGLLSAPLLYLIDPAYVPGPVLVLGGVLSGWVTLRHHREICWRRVLPASLARIPGAWLGAFLLLTLPGAGLGLVLGAGLLLALTVSYYRFSLKATSLSLSLAGFSSGVLGTATSVGGPPMAMVYQQTDNRTTRNELALFFLLTTPVSVLMLYGNGLFDRQSLMLSLPLLPGVWLGCQLARLLNHYLDEQRAKTVLFALCLLAALAVLTKALLQLG